MQQLTLNLQPRIQYHPDKFELHSGVRELSNALHLGLSRVGSNLFFIEGAPRTGKTHFTVFLAANLTKQGIYPRLLESQKLFIGDKLSIEWNHNEVIIVDDMHHYLAQCIPGKSGEFVNLIEEAKRRGIAVALFSAVSLEQLPCDQHIISRLKQVRYTIAAPDDGEMFSIINRMALQRGIVLTTRKINYLIKRIGREIPAVERYLDNLELLSQVRGRPYHLDIVADAV